MDATLLLTPFFLNDTMCTIHSLCLKGPHSGFKGWGDQDELPIMLDWWGKIQNFESYPQPFPRTPHLLAQERCVLAF